MKRYSIFLAALAGLSCACSTELKSVRIVDPDTIPVAGAPYNLTYTRFKVKVIRRVASCYDAPAKEKGGKDDQPAIRVKVQASAEAEQRRDPLRNYVLDLGSLQGAFKSSDVQVSYYDTGGIKSINASAEDKTGEVLASVAQTAAKLVGASAVAAGVALTEGRTVQPERCQPMVEVAVRELPGREAELAARTVEIDRKVQQLQQYLAVAVAMGRTLPRADRDNVTQAIRELNALRDANIATQAQIASYLDLISVQDDVSWPENGETFVSAAPVLEPVDATVLMKWMGTTSASFQDATAVYLELKASEAMGRVRPCTKDCPDQKVEGLKYRMPALGSLSMCSELRAAAGKEPPACIDGQVVAQNDMISQLGPIFTLPLKSAVFTNKSIVATFAENGVPTSLGTKASAAADKAAATFGSLADASIAAGTSRAGREAAELESKIKVLTLKKQLADATEALAPPPKDPKKEATDTFTVDTAMLNAELANRAARQALDEARQRMPPP